MPAKRSKNTFKSYFAKRLEAIKNKKPVNKGKPSARTVRVKNQIYYSLNEVGKMTGIIPDCLWKYSKDPRATKYRRWIEGYHTPFYSYGIIGLFLRIRKENLAKGKPKKKRGIKAKKRNYKWYAGDKIPNWAKPNTQKKHKLNKDIDITKFNF